MSIGSTINEWGSGLEELKEKGLLRTLRSIRSRPGAQVVIDGRTVVNFASNNYLDLASHPAVLEGAKLALDEAGAGATVAVTCPSPTW